MPDVISVDKRLKSALNPLGYEVAKNIYQGSDATYIVFNYNTIPAHHGDDEPEFDRYLIQVHLFAPVSFKAGPVVKQIKFALRDAGFVYPTTEQAGDETGQHVVIETEWAEGIDGDD